MFELKPIHPDSIEQALEKAQHYRLLNEPGEAESICLDVLAIEPEHQAALVTLLLSLTDRMAKGHSAGARQAKEVLPRLKDEYQRHYYAGLICERQAKVRLQQGGPGANHDAYEWLCDALRNFEHAENMRSTGNDEAILRWNACVRIIERNQLSARTQDNAQHFLE